MSSESKVDDGGPAFPSVDYTGSIVGGMTLRDWFAGQCLSGLVSLGNQLCDEGLESECANNAEVVASQAYFIADAMLKARNK